MSHHKVINKAVFLDLDGVLFDTVKEAYCISTLTAKKAESIRDISFKSEHFRIFKTYRFLITCAGDYSYLLSAIEKKMKNKKIDVEKEFAVQSKLKSEENKRFEKLFFEVRREIKNNYHLSCNLFSII